MANQQHIWFEIIYITGYTELTRTKARVLYTQQTSKTFADLTIRDQRSEIKVWATVSPLWYTTYRRK